MAESPSSALPGGVEWLPALGGARLLRAQAGGGDAPALILDTSEDGEHRIESRPGTRFSPHAEYLVPAGLSWAAAWLQWPDGTRATIPTPDSARAEIIELRVRRASPEAEPPAPRRDGAGPDLPWTTPPQAGASNGAAAEAEWRSRRAELERELSRAAESLARAREGERAARDSVLAALAGARADLRAVRAAREADASALATLAGELDAERIAHAVARGSVVTLAEDLAAARAGLAAARATVEVERETGADARAHLASARRDAAMARAEVASLRAVLDAERAARARIAADLRDARDDSALLQRVAALDRQTAGVRGQFELERRAREHAEAAAAATRRPSEPGAAAAATTRPPDQTGRLLADLDAAAAAAPTRPPDQTGRLLADLDAAAAALRASAPTAAAAPAVDVPPAAQPAGSSPVVAAPPEPPPSGGSSSVALVPANAPPRLRLALVALAREDAVAAGQLLAGLLPAQGAALEGALSYDLTVRGVGTFAVSVGGGSARVRRLPRRRLRSEALFHLAGDALVLAELLAGEQRRVGRFARKARVTGRRKRARALAALPAARLSLAEAVRAGARLDPSLVYRALPFAVAPEWTRGHTFTVAQEIVELAPRAWYVTARDGAALRVVEHMSAAPADATVTMTRAAFDRLLRGEPAAEGERPVIRGDRAAVEALKRWTDLARGG